MTDPRSDARRGVGEPAGGAEVRDRTARRQQQHPIAQAEVGDGVGDDDDGTPEVTCEPPAFDAVSKAFEAAGTDPVVSEITYKALNEVKLTGEDAEKMQKLIDALEDLDDVQQVYTSADFDDEE